MKAFVINRPGEAGVTELEKPSPREGEVLVKVMAAGICGTDAHIYKGEYMGSYPCVPGHEFSGVVASLGRGAGRFRVGQRVTADPNISCDACAPCRENKQNYCENAQTTGVTLPGAMAEYVAVPEKCVFDAEGVGFTEAAMAEPLSCVLYGAERVRGMLPAAASVLISGAGPIGLTHLQVARLNGAADVTVTDLFESKLELARALGADHAVNAAEFEGSARRGRYDLVIDCTGIPRVIEGSVKYARDSGVLLIFGVCPVGSEVRLDPYEIFRREITVTGSYALKRTLGRALELIRGGKINLMPLVGERFSLEGAEGAIRDMIAGKAGMKAMIYPNGVE